MAVIEVTKENIKEEVADYQGTVLLDFWAVWCGPCRAMSPIVDEIAKEHPEIKVGKVNVDEQMELGRLFKIANIPTLLVIRNGKILNKQIGLAPKEKVLELLA